MQLHLVVWAGIEVGCTYMLTSGWYIFHGDTHLSLDVERSRECVELVGGRFLGASADCRLFSKNGT
jgi:hypothetical protein